MIWLALPQKTSLICVLTLYVMTECCLDLARARGKRENKALRYMVSITEKKQLSIIIVPFSLLLLSDPVQFIYIVITLLITPFDTVA